MPDWGNDVQGPNRLKRELSAGWITPKEQVLRTGVVDGAGGTRQLSWQVRKAGC